MLKLKVLGSGSGASDPLRFQSSVVLSFEDESYIMLDCGEPAGHQLMKYGFELDDLELIVISHMHADHFSGIFQLLKNMQIRRRTKALKIIMPSEGHKVFREFLEMIYLSEKTILQFDLNIVTPQDEAASTVGEVQMSFMPTRHLRDFASISGNPGECNSMILKYGSKRIVHSSDLESVDEICERLQEKTDLFIVEMAHFPPEKLFSEIAASEFIPEIILITHFGPAWTDKEEDIRTIALENKIKTKVIMAKDGLEILL